ncbi:MAG: helix-turn-helix domain-containing protein [Bacteroidota bacterium]
MPEFLKLAVFILAIQGIVTSLILCASKPIRDTHHKFLVLFVLIFSCYLLGQNLFWGNFYVENPHFLFSTVAFPFLFGPLLYFYATPYKKHRYAYLHFLPFMLLLINHIPFYLFSAKEKIDFYFDMILTLEVNSKFYIYRLAFVAQIIVYFLVIRNSIRHEGVKRSFKWYRTLNTFYGSLAAAYLFQMIVYSFEDKVGVVTFFFVVFYIVKAAFILYFVTKTLLVPELFRSVARSKRNPLNDVKKTFYSEQILLAMETDQLYMKKDLRLIDLANRINSTEHLLSQLLREHFGVNFFEFINSYRINSAKKLLLDEDYKHFTIDAIAQEVGFKSKSSFYESFNKFVGTTPLAYKKQHRKFSNGEE